jgi:hypothetical protein
VEPLLEHVPRRWHLRRRLMRTVAAIALVLLTASSGAAAQSPSDLASVRVTSVGAITDIYVQVVIEVASKSEAPLAEVRVSCGVLDADKNAIGEQGTIVRNVGPRQTAFATVGVLVAKPRRPPEAKSAVCRVIDAK